jgi:hypothetical protein
MIVDYRGKKLKVPDFLVVGAARSGTTTLYYLLGRHPRIFFPTEKEPTFFSVYGQQWSYIDIRTGKKVAYIEEELDGYLKLFEAAGPDQLLGEGSTWYLYLYQATIDNIQKIYGDKSTALRVLILLRNPVERAWSHYWLKRRNGEEKLGFEEAIGAAVVKQRQERRYVPSFNYIDYGRYFLQIKAYREAFERVKVLLLEDLTSDMARQVVEIFEFLGVEPIDVSNKMKRLNVAGNPKNRFYGFLKKFIYQPNSLKSFSKELLPRRMRANWKNNIGKVLFRHEPMPNDLRTKLAEVYRADILALSKLIGRDLNHWLS